MKIKTSHNSTKKTSCEVKKRVLISVNVQGSAGPIRLLVNEDDSVERVIDSALKLYGRMSRIPVLGSDPDRFLLCYQGPVGHVVLGPQEVIGVTGARSFVMAKNPSSGPEPVHEKGHGSALKAWLHKSLSFKIMSSH